MSEAQFASEEKEGTLTVRLEGRLHAYSVGAVWTGAENAVRGSKNGVIVDASAVSHCDASGIALLLNLKGMCDTGKRSCEIRGLRDEFRVLMDRVVAETAPPRAPDRLSFLERLGRFGWNVARDFKVMLGFLGETWAGIIWALFHPRKLRWKETFLAAERLGADALPIVTVTGFLIGTVVALSSVNPLRQFGAEIFVANTVALAIVRGVGPLLTGLILSGRSGSAIAAELGTMKINQEVDALTVMGLDPVRTLVVPRVLAALILVPSLAVITSLAGFVGGGLVFVSLDYPVQTYVNRCIEAVQATDIAFGMYKAILYGFLFSWIACLRGLQTGRGPATVGVSTVKAVVHGMVLIILGDAVMTFINHISETA